MSMPPQGGWPPPQSGPQPPNQRQYSPPPGHQPYPGQQPYPSQGQWQQPPPPQKSGRATKWLMVAIAVLLVIGVTIGATLLFTRDGDGSSTPPNSDVPSDIASANDTGPVSIITEEPTCEAYTAINNALASVGGAGWGDQRGSLGPVSEWTPTQRAQVETVVRTIQNASAEIASLAKQTPNRLVRELYEQYIAYGRAYSNSVATYTPRDNYLASANVSAGSALMAICNSITYGGTNRALSIGPGSEPTALAPVPDPGTEAMFLTDENLACKSWIERDIQFGEDTRDWAALDTSISGSEWSPEQKSVQLAALPKLTDWAEDMSQLGRQSDNPVFMDVADAAALYLRAYVTSGESYVKADSFLTTTAFRLSNAITSACRYSAP
jgi:hypothetical protein